MSLSRLGLQTLIGGTTRFSFGAIGDGQPVVAVLTTDLDPGFERALISAAYDLGLQDPVDLAKVLYSESKIQPHILGGGACDGYFPVGINQFCPNTLVGYFNPNGYNPSSMSVEDKKQNAELYRQLPASEQLGYVKKFLQHLAPIHSARDLYWANFLPATVVKDAPDDHVIAAPGMVLPGGLTGEKVIASNKSFVNADGTITAGDLQKAIDRSAQGARWNEIVQRIRASEGGSPPPYVPSLPGAPDLSNLPTLPIYQNPTPSNPAKSSTRASTGLVLITLLGGIGLWQYTHRQFPFAKVPSR